MKEDKAFSELYRKATEPMAGGGDTMRACYGLACWFESHGDLLNAGSLLKRAVMLGLGPTGDGSASSSSILGEVLDCLVNVLTRIGEMEAAVELSRRCVLWQREEGDGDDGGGRWLSDALRRLGSLLLTQGQVEGALPVLQEAVERARYQVKKEGGDSEIVGLCLCLEALCEVYERMGRAEDSYRLAVEADKLWKGHWLKLSKEKRR